MLDRDLLALLADGELHSGVALGQALGLTRAAVWKRLQQLKSLGVELEQVRGRGYRLRHGLRLLEQPVIAALLDAPLALEVHDELASTNDRGLELARSAAVQPVAILAERQSAGRGRLGRRWESPLGHNLYLTLVWPFTAGVQLQGLSLVVGLVLAETLTQLGLRDAGIKWPNDLHVRRRKLGGILLELSGDLEARPIAVIGVGVNGWLGDELAGRIDQPATDWLTEVGQPLDRNRLAGLLLHGLQQALPLFAASGFAAFRARWQAFDLCAGQSLWLVQGQARRQVRALGVADDGALRVEHDQQEQSVYGGEVSIRWQ